MLVDGPSPQFQATDIPLVLNRNIAFHLSVKAVDHDVAREDQARSTLSPGFVQVDQVVGVGLVDLAIGPGERLTQRRLQEPVLDHSAREGEGQGL